MGVQHLKIVIAGRINSGKTTFIRSIDETEVVSLVYGWTRDDYVKDRERRQHKRNSGLRGYANVGKVMVDDDLSLSLYRASSNLISMSSIPRGMHGFLVLVDSTDERSLVEGRVLLLYMMYFPIVPCIVVANKQDLPGALSVEQVREKMRLPDRITLMPCIAKERDSVRAVLLELIYTMPGL